MYKTAIYDAIETLLNGDGRIVLSGNNMPEISYFGLWTGQDEEPEANLPIKYPAILLDFEPVNWQNAGKGTQIGLATVAIRVVQQSLVSTSKNAAVSNKEKTVQLLSLSAYIDWLIRHKLIVTDSFGKFKRVADGAVRKDKSIYSEIIRYEVSVNDNLNLDIYKYGKPLIITVEK